MNLTRALDRVDIPVLLISGWHDLFLEQTLEQYAHLRGRGVDVALTVGPWGHIAVGAGARDRRDQRHVRMVRGARRGT